MKRIKKDGDLETWVAEKFVTAVTKIAGRWVVSTMDGQAFQADEKPAKELAGV